MSPERTHRASIALPPTTRRLRFTAVPEFAEGLAPPMPAGTFEGQVGWYAVQAGLTVGGAEVLGDDVNLSRTLANAHCNVVLEAATTISLHRANWPQVRNAALHTRTDGRVTHASLRVKAKDFRDAERTAHTFVAPVLSYLAFAANVQVQILLWQMIEERTQVLRWSFVARGGAVVGLKWTPQHALNLSSVHPDIQALHSAYREGLNSTNPFYRFLCYWKVTEGCLANHKRRTRRGGIKVAEPDPMDSRVPTSVAGLNVHGDDADVILALAGQAFGTIRQGMRDVFRNAISHMTLTGPSLDADRFDDVLRCERAIPIIAFIAREVLSKEMAAYDL